MSATSNHAVNGSQLHGASQSVANALGGGASVDANGAVTAPSYSVQGANQTSVGGAITALDGAITATNGAVSALQGQTNANSGAITNLQNQVTSNTSNITTLQGQVADNTNAIAANTGAITTLQGQVGASNTAITNLQGAVNANTTAIGDLTDAVSAGTIGLVQQAAPGAGLTVGAQTDGGTVNFAGTGGNRQLTGVAAGALDAVSTDAVNGSQLAATNVRVQAIIDGIIGQQFGGFTSDNALGANLPIASGTNASAGGGGAVASGAWATAVGNASQASAQNATALGSTAQASAQNATAVGSGAQATGTNSVAIGANASDDGMSDVVSVGSSTATRRVVYVSAGIAPTDAANVGQLQSGMAQTLASANEYTDGRVAALGFDLGEVREDSRRGIAAVAALGYAPMPSEPGRTSYSVNGAFFRGYQAIGGSVAHRLNTEVPLAATAGFAYGGNGNNIVRVGVAGEF